jgi:hypothetical protein
MAQAHDEAAAEDCSAVGKDDRPRSGLVSAVVKNDARQTSVNKRIFLSMAKPRHRYCRVTTPVGVQYLLSFNGNSGLNVAETMARTEYFARRTSAQLLVRVRRTKLRKTDNIEAHK